MWRAGVLVLGIAVGGCWSSGSVASTQLTIETRTGPAATELHPSRATLRCDRTAIATGFLRDTARPACALVHRGAVQKVAADQRSRRGCSTVYGGPQTAHLTGTINGHRVNVSITRTDGCGTADWQTLMQLLGDPNGPKIVPTTTTAPPITYLVKRGDTLTALATRFGVPTAAIVTLNHLANPDHLAEGQRLLIPPVPPIQLLITPPDAQAGAAFRLELIGAKPSETVTFEIDAPGHKYTGPPHTPSADGVIKATYHSEVGDAAGTYGVIARGSRGTTARASFRVDSASTTPTSAPL